MYKYSHINIISNIKSLNMKSLENIKTFLVKTEEKAKGTMFENWLKYWKTVFLDYKDVVIDVKADVINRPIKAACTLTVFSALTYCVKHNPDLVSYRDNFISSANKVLLVHPSAQNINATQHLKQIEIDFNRNALHRLNLGIASIIWKDYYSSACRNSEATCKYLQMSFADFKNHIVDIGFLDRWWILINAMENYDINY